MTGSALIFLAASAALWFTLLRVFDRPSPGEWQRHMPGLVEHRISDLCTPACFYTAFAFYFLPLYGAFCTVYAYTVLGISLSDVGLPSEAISILVLITALVFGSRQEILRNLEMEWRSYVHRLFGFHQDLSRRLTMALRRDASGPSAEGLEEDAAAHAPALAGPLRELHAMRASLDETMADTNFSGARHCGLRTLRDKADALLDTADRYLSARRQPAPEAGSPEQRTAQRQEARLRSDLEETARATAGSLFLVGGTGNDGSGGHQRCDLSNLATVVSWGMSAALLASVVAGLTRWATGIASWAFEAELPLSYFVLSDGTSGAIMHGVPLFFAFLAVEDWRRMPAGKPVRPLRDRALWMRGIQCLLLSLAARIAMNLLQTGILVGGGNLVDALSDAFGWAFRSEIVFALASMLIYFSFVCLIEATSGAVRPRRLTAVAAHVARVAVAVALAIAAYQAIVRSAYGLGILESIYPRQVLIGTLNVAIVATIVASVFCARGD